MTSMNMDIWSKMNLRDSVKCSDSNNINFFFFDDLDSKDKSQSCCILNLLFYIKISKGYITLI